MDNPGLQWTPTTFCSLVCQQSMGKPIWVIEFQVLPTTFAFFKVGVKLGANVEFRFVKVICVEGSNRWPTFVFYTTGTVTHRTSKGLVKMTSLLKDSSLVRLI